MACQDSVTDSGLSAVSFEALMIAMKGWIIGIF
jgi:hypothetical protein